MVKPPLSAGIVAGPWESLSATTVLRKPQSALPYYSTFIACVWRVPPKKGDGLGGARFFWSAGPLSHGEALDLEEGQGLADRSLQEQGVVLA